MNDKELKAANNMIDHGGSFVQALGLAFWKEVQNGK